MNKLACHYYLLFIISCFNLGIGQNKTLNLYLEIDNNLTKNTFNSYNKIKKYTDSLSYKLQQKGFLSSYYSEPIKKNDSTFYSSLIKNEQTSFVSISNFKELPSEIKKTLRITKKQKEYSIPISELQKHLTFLNYQLSEDGSPFNSIQLQNINSKKDTIIANLKITHLKQRKIDSIVIKGYPKFPLSFLRHFLGIKEGILYQNEKIQKKTEQINNLPFVSNIKPAEVLFNPTSTQIYVYLKKKNANNFDGFLGFSTEEETGNLTLDGYINLNLINNLNFGEELAITYKSDSEDQSLFNVQTTLPYLFKLPLSLEAGLNIFRKKDDFSTTEQNIGFSYAFSPQVSSLISYKTYESADLTDNENLVGSIDQNFDAQFLNLEARYTIRQPQLLFPTKTVVLAASEIGSRTQKSTKTEQYKFSLKAHHIFQLNPNNSIYIANNAQFLLSDNYLANELFRFGGILSIRGFEENSLRATLFNVTNTEYRYQLSNSIYAHSIIDFAFTENKFTNTTNQLTSFGVGIGMLTKAGLFKLNYANGTSSDIPFEFKNSKVHISLTTYF